MVLELIDKAQKAFEVKDLYNSEKYLCELKKKNISSIDVDILEAKILIEKHYIKEALELINQVLKDESDNLEALKIKGKISSCIGKKEVAYETYKKILLLDNENIENKFYLGRATINLGLYEEAREIYKELFHYSKNNEVTGYFESCNKYIIKELSQKEELSIEDKISLAKAKYYLGMLDEALELLVSVDNYYDDYSILLYLTNIYRIKEEYDKGLKYSNRLIELDSNNPRGAFNKGMILEELLKIDEAIDNYNLAIKIDSSYKPVYNKLNSLIIRKGNDNNLSEKIEEAIKINYDYEISLLNKGVFLEENKNYEDALYYYDEAINYFPRYVDAYTRKINLYRKMKNYQEAFEVSEKALDVCYQDYRIVIAKSLVLREIGQYSSALEWIEWVLDEKKHYELYYFKALFLCDLEEYSEALDSIEEAIRLRRGDIINWCLKIYINNRINIQNYSEIISESCSEGDSIEEFINEVNKSISVLKIDDTYMKVINIIKNM